MGKQFPKYGDIVAVCDVDFGLARTALGQFSDASKYQDYRKMLDRMHKQIDAVVVSTPDHTHFHPSMAAMELGKHLYCEKPCAISIDLAGRLADTIHRTGAWALWTRSRGRQRA